MTSSIIMTINNVPHDILHILHKLRSDEQMLWDFTCEKISDGEVENVSSAEDIETITIVENQVNRQNNSLSEDSGLNEKIRSHNEEQAAETKFWNNDRTLALINIYKDNEMAFNTGMKKIVRGRIAKKMNKEFNDTRFNIKNVESKWKTIKRTYKNIKVKNNKSGNATHRWEYFSIMQQLFEKRPEITPPAVCTTTSLIINSPNEISGDPDEIPSLSKDQKSKPGNKKRVPNVNDRHREKMARTDRFLDSFDRLIEKL